MKTLILLCLALPMASAKAQTAAQDTRPPWNQPPGHTPLTPGYPTGVDGSRTLPPSLAYENAFVSLRKRAEKLHATVGAGEAEMQGLLGSIQTNAAFLQTRWQEWSKANPAAYVGNAANDPYLRSLERNYDLLRKAEQELERLQKARQRGRGARDGASAFHGLPAPRPSRTESGGAWSATWAATTGVEAGRAKVLELLGIVDTDLQVKADHCRQSRSGLGRTIQVLVRTRHEGAEAPGYEVWFVQRGYYGTKSAYDRFRKQSSPTDERGLAPGGYAFWVQKGREASEPTTVRLGGSGEERVEVDLEVP